MSESSGDAVLLARRAAVLHRIWHDGPLEMADLVDLIPAFGTSPELAEHLIILGQVGLIEMDAEPIDPLFGPSMEAGAEEQARRTYGELLGVPMCCVCGCSDNWACEDGCWWLAEGVCSNCGGSDSLLDDAVGA